MTDGVLMDLSGVLYTGDHALPGAAEALARLRAAGVPVRFLTNTTRKPRRAILEKLARLGLAVEDAALFTPARAALDRLAAEGRRAHLLIHPDLAEDFAEAPRAGPVAVVVGDAGRHFTYDALNAAFRELAAGAPFLALAANRVFEDADGALSLDAGAFVQALAFASGTEPVVLGKPARAFFEAAAGSMGLELDAVAMIGDDAEADVAGALAAGVGRAVLVRTGKYRDGDEDRVSPPPSAVVDGVVDAVEDILE